VGRGWIGSRERDIKMMRRGRKGGGKTKGIRGKGRGQEVGLDHCWSSVASAFSVTPPFGDKLEALLGVKAEILPWLDSD
jgi:hypothetical protein